MATPVPPWKVVWITGAGRGIGRQLALDLARSGVKVAASARTVADLTALAAEHPNITSFPLDVAKPDDVAATVRAITGSLGPIDLAILNAGIWQPFDARAFEGEKSRQSMEVNYFGITNALDALIPDMVARGAGHLALVASVAGYRGLPKAAAYAPSKAAVIALAEVLRLELERRNITVSLVNPGFVETPMTSVNEFPMPFIVSSETASRIILGGLARRKYEVVFPWQMLVAMKVLRALPNALFFRLAKRML
ncbi:MAG TPA: SDR family NAD(P)-dependent oxidoreductase [Hyphomicrobiaceae bacterium]|nr:SDR family NAD(P)-dependent oxidoreductase [Hyphomicrobiaceae bacterium]